MTARVARGNVFLLRGGVEEKFLAVGQGQNPRSRAGQQSNSGHLRDEAGQS